MNNQFKNYSLQFRISNGFSLIELLVVVAIVSILTAFLVSNYLASQIRGRDDRRKSDLQQIAAAIEAYRADNGVYPCDGDCTTYTKRACALAALMPKYMAKVPNDPGRNDPNCTAGSVPDCSDYYVYWFSYNKDQYTLYANLENANDPDAVKTKKNINIQSAVDPNDAPSVKVRCGSGAVNVSTFNYWINNQ